jgi:hypothetical protein
VIPLERYWFFPFIASREGPVLHLRGWREKKEKNKKRGKVVPSRAVPLSLPMGPDDPVDDGDIPALQPRLPPVTCEGVVAQS